MCQTRFQRFVWGGSFLVFGIALIIIGSLSPNLIITPIWIENNIKSLIEDNILSSYESGSFITEKRQPKHYNLGINTFFYNITNLNLIYSSNGPGQERINVQEIEVIVPVNVTCQWISTALGDTWYGNSYYWCNYDKSQKPSSQLDEYIIHVNPIFFMVLAGLHNEQWLGIWAGSQQMYYWWNYYGAYEGTNTREWRHFWVNALFYNFISLWFSYSYNSATNPFYDWNIPAFSPHGDPIEGVKNFLRYWSDIYSDNWMANSTHKIYPLLGVYKMRTLTETFHDVCLGGGNDPRHGTNSFCYFWEFPINSPSLNLFQSLDYYQAMNFWLSNSTNGDTCFGVFCVPLGSISKYGVVDGGISAWFSLMNRAKTYADMNPTDFSSRYYTYIYYYTNPAYTSYPEVEQYGFYRLVYTNTTIDDVLAIMNWLNGIDHRDSVGLWVWIKNQMKSNINTMYNAYYTHSWYNINNDDRDIAFNLLDLVYTYEDYGGLQWGSSRQFRYSDPYLTVNTTSNRMSIVNFDHNYEWFSYWNPSFKTLKHLLTPQQALSFLSTFGNWNNLKAFLAGVDWLKKMRCVAFDPCNSQRGCCPLNGGTSWCSCWGFQNFSTFWLDAQNTADVWEYMSYNMGFVGRMHGGETRNLYGIYLGNSGMFSRHTIRELLMGYSDVLGQWGGFLPISYNDENDALSQINTDLSGNTGWTFYNGLNSDGSYNFERVNKIRSFNGITNITFYRDFNPFLCTSWPTDLRIFSDCDVKFYNKPQILTDVYHEFTSGLSLFHGIRTSQIPDYFDIFFTDMFRIFRMNCVDGTKQLLGYENGPVVCEYVHPIFKANNNQDNYIEHDGIQPLYHLYRSIDYYIVKGHFYQAPIFEANKITGLQAPTKDLDEATLTVDPNIGVIVGSHRLLMFLFRLRSFSLEHVIPWINENGFDGARQWVYSICNDTDDICSTVKRPYLNFFYCDYLGSNCPRDDVYIPFVSRKDHTQMTSSEATTHNELLNSLYFENKLSLGTSIGVGCLFVFIGIFCFYKARKTPSVASFYADYELDDYAYDL